MLLSLKRLFAPGVLLLAVFQAFTPCFAFDLPTRIARVFPHKVDDLGKKPKTWKDGCVEELAHNIDWLEHHINMNGSVVAKTPDVWGEARLTAHRQEFEDVLKQELNAFQKNKIQGAEFVSDQAFLAMALALDATGGTSSAANVTVPSITQQITAPNSSPSAPANSVNSSGTTITQSTINPPTIFGFEPKSIDTSTSIQVEQTEILDQLANYVNHLHMLRRNNEGPDNADEPGYAMNLIRIPISVMPGQNTKRGYGAEITLTAEPYLGPELLPTAFKEMVINDLVDQLALPLAQYLNSDPAEIAATMDAINFISGSDSGVENVTSELKSRSPTYQKTFMKYVDSKSGKTRTNSEHQGTPHKKHQSR